jgi:hypothetical protein
MLQQLARAEKPSAPAELCTAITENLRAEDFADLRISLASHRRRGRFWGRGPSLRRRARWMSVRPFRAHLLKTAPQPWREAVLDGN